MKPAACLRLFEVEALRDGRLNGAERVSFERHLSSCAACAREARQLDELARALREPLLRGDELSARRERVRLLAAFDRSLLRPSADVRADRYSRLFAVGVAAAALASLFFVWGWRRLAEPLPTPRAAVRPSVHATWSRQVRDQREVVTLEQGELHIQVHHVAGSLPLLVALPDGELEDIGTTFSVVVQAGHTISVTVDEGRVLLRLREHAPIVLAAHDAWSPAVVSALPVAPTMPSSAPAASAPPVTAASSGASASDDFRAAMASFNGGRNREAAARFARFLAAHPRDARSEDAAYLRVLALRAIGDASAMHVAAQDYLRRYPTAFRHSEVERLLQ